MAFGNYNYNPYINPYMSPYNAPQSPQFTQPVQFPAPAQQTQQTPVHAPQNGFVWVDGIDEANAFYVAPNNAVQLWDKNAPTIYKKSADSTGKPSMQIFDLVERKPEVLLDKAAEKTDFVGRQEFDELKQKVDALIVRRSKPKKTIVEDDEFDE